MVSIDMCEHFWPGSGCKECMREQSMPSKEFSRAKAERFKSTIRQDSLWMYNGVIYKVNSLMEHNLSQDPATGEWESTVRYTSCPQTHLVFYRSYTEWLRKFTPVKD